jgi:hypothetical protein
VPYSEDFATDRGRGRDSRETGLRNFALWFIDTGYVVALPALSLAALGIACYGFTVSFGEGARSLIFFVIPVMWGAYTLAVNDGNPQASRSSRRKPSSASPPRPRSSLGPCSS